MSSAIDGPQQEGHTKMTDDDEFDDDESQDVNVNPMDDVYSDPTDHFIQAMFDEGERDRARLPNPDDCTEAGWYWFCDDHITHGNADSEAEARAILAAHVAYQRDFEDTNCEGLYVVDVGVARTHYINKQL
jgi:hypothetical protein